MFECWHERRWSDMSLASLNGRKEGNVRQKKHQQQPCDIVYFTLRSIRIKCSCSIVALKLLDSFHFRLEFEVRSFSSDRTLTFFSLEFHSGKNPILIWVEHVLKPSNPYTWTLMNTQGKEPNSFPRLCDICCSPKNFSKEINLKLYSILQLYNLHRKPPHMNVIRIRVHYFIGISRSFECCHILSVYSDFFVWQPSCRYMNHNHKISRHVSIFVLRFFSHVFRKFLPKLFVQPRLFRQYSCVTFIFPFSCAKFPLSRDECQSCLWIAQLHGTDSFSYLQMIFALFSACSFALSLLVLFERNYWFGSNTIFASPKLYFCFIITVNLTVLTFVSTPN